MTKLKALILGAVKAVRDMINGMVALDNEIRDLSTILDTDVSENKKLQELIEWNEFRQMNGLHHTSSSDLVRMVSNKCAVGVSLDDAIRQAWTTLYCGS
jgi:hypothetical protein